VSLDLVALGGAPDVADVQMAGQEKIGAHFGELRHGHVRAPDDVLGGDTFRHVERMMRDDNLDEARWRAPEAIGRPDHLHLTQPPCASHDKRACGVEPDDGHFLVLVSRLEIL
jgi:hypothetical protein